MGRTQGYPPDGDSQDSAARRAVRVRILGGQSELRSAMRDLFADPPAWIEVVVEWAPGGGGEGNPAPEPRPARYARRLPVRRAGGVIRCLKVEHLDWIEAANQYVRLHAGGKGVLVRESMARLEKSLDPQQFLRIHRSAIVNLERIRELRIESPSHRWAVLFSDERLPVSQGRWEHLQQALFGFG